MATRIVPQRDGIATPLTPAQQATIENALSIALHFLRHPDAVPASIKAAAARVTLAASLLQQASEGRR